MRPATILLAALTSDAVSANPFLRWPRRAAQAFDLADQYSNPVSTAVLPTTPSSNYVSSVPTAPGSWFDSSKSPSTKPWNPKTPMGSYPLGTGTLPTGTDVGTGIFPTGTGVAPTGTGYPVGVPVETLITYVTTTICPVTQTMGSKVITTTTLSTITITSMATVYSCKGGCDHLTIMPIGLPSVEPVTTVLPIVVPTSALTWFPTSIPVGYKGASAIYSTGMDSSLVDSSVISYITSYLSEVAPSPTEVPQSYVSDTPSSLPNPPASSWGKPFTLVPGTVAQASDTPVESSQWPPTASPSTLVGAVSTMEPSSPNSAPLAASTPYNGGPDGNMPKESMVTPQAPQCPVPTTAYATVTVTFSLPAPPPVTVIVTADKECPSTNLPSSEAPESTGISVMYPVSSGAGYATMSPSSYGGLNPTSIAHSSHWDVTAWYGPETKAHSSPAATNTPVKPSTSIMDYY